jgi:hypothetical protein
VNALELNPDVLDSQVPAADPLLWRVIERHADALLASQQPIAETTAERTRRLLKATRRRECVLPLHDRQPAVHE